MRVIPTISLKGYKIRDGAAYAILAQISLYGAPQQVRQQIEDGHRRLSGLKLVELHWRIAEKDLPLFREALRADHVSATVEDVESRTFYGLPINVLRGPEHRDSQAPAQAGAPKYIRRHHLRG